MAARTRASDGHCLSCSTCGPSLCHLIIVMKVPGEHYKFGDSPPPADSGDIAEVRKDVRVCVSTRGACVSPSRFSIVFKSEKGLAACTISSRLKGVVGKVFVL